jgi:hypothetical protein
MRDGPTNHFQHVPIFHKAFNEIGTVLISFALWAKEDEATPHCVILKRITRGSTALFKYVRFERRYTKSRREIKKFCFKDASKSLAEITKEIYFKNIELTSWLRGFVLAVSLLSSGPALASQGGGENPASYLELGAGGPPEAMGGAAAALRGDVSCGFWNPAGLTGLKGLQAEDQYSFLPQGQQLNYLALGSQFHQRLFYSLAFFYYTAGGDLEARGGPSLNPDNLFTDSQMAFLVSLAGKLGPRWALGGTLKLFLHKLGVVSGTGFGGDLGIQYRFSNETTGGLAIQDVYSFIGYSNSSAPGEVFPVAVRGGVSHTAKTVDLRGELDLEWRGDTGLRPRLGLEWKPSGDIALRGGFWWGLDSGSANFSAGFGLRVPGAGESAELDYTLLGDRWASGGLLHQISLKGTFL